MTDRYIVTGVTTDGRRFRLIYTHCRHALYHVMHINLWRGSVWEEVNGKRKLIKRVIN